MDQLIGMPRYWEKSSFPSNRFSFQDNKMVEVSSICSSSCCIVLVAAAVGFRLALSPFPNGYWTVRHYETRYGAVKVNVAAEQMPSRVDVILHHRQRR